MVVLTVRKPDDCHRKHGAKPHQIFAIRCRRGRLKQADTNLPFSTVNQWLSVTISSKADRIWLVSLAQNFDEGQA
jgi:hypothetical protein